MINRPTVATRGPLARPAEACTAPARPSRGRRAVLGALMTTLVCVAMSACDRRASTPVAQPSNVGGEAPAGATPAAKRPVTLRSDHGRTVSLPGPARRVVSLSPALTEVLFAVGCGETLVGRDGWSDFPPEVEAAPKLAGLVPPVEAVAALRPDLVLTHFPPARLRSGLDALAIPWVGLAPGTLADVADAFVVVGAACGRAEAGLREAAAFRAAVAATRRRAHRHRRVRVYLELDPGGGRPHTVGARTFLDEVLRTAGGTNVFATRSGWLQVSAEQVLTARPEVVVFTTHETRSDRLAHLRTQLQQRPGWASLPGASRLVAVSPDLLARPGPRLLDGLRRVADALALAASQPLDLPAMPTVSAP